MGPLGHIDLPAEFRISSVEKNSDGETNDVFLCRGEFGGRLINAYIKVNKNPNLSLSNECAVLAELESADIPVPRVVWYGGEQNEVLIIEALSGHMIWDFIDPRRRMYDGSKALEYLRQYGECLASIHSLPIRWAPQKRPGLYGFIGEEKAQDERFACLVAWLQSNPVVASEQVFVHGDFNTASVLFRDGSVSGVVDWEFAGNGWREYDLAWALRSRLSFLNTQEERDAILKGYTRRARYDDDALRFCEVLNYLHFAYWATESESLYTSFAIARAMEITGLG